MRLPPSTGTSSTPSRKLATPGRSWVAAPSPNGGEKNVSPFLPRTSRGSPSNVSDNDESRAPLPGAVVSNDSGTGKISSSGSVSSSKNTKPSFLRERKPHDGTPISSNRSVSSQGSYQSRSRSTFRSKGHGSIISSKLESLEQRIASSGSMGSTTDARSEASSSDPQPQQQIEKPKPRFLQRNTSYASMNNESVCSDASTTDKPKFLRNHSAASSTENVLQESSSSLRSNSNSSDDENVKDELLERLQKEYITHSEQIESLQQELDKEKKKSRSEIQKKIDEVATLRKELEKEKEKAADSDSAINKVKVLEKELAQAKQHAVELEDQATEEVDRLYNELDREKKAAKELEDQATEEVDRLYRELEDEKKASKQLETQANEEIERLTEALENEKCNSSTSDDDCLELKDEISRLKLELQAEKRKGTDALAEMEEIATATLAKERQTAAELIEKERQKSSTALKEEREKSASLIEKEREKSGSSIKKERQEAKELIEKERQKFEATLKKKEHQILDLERENERLVTQLEKGGKEVASELQNELKQQKQLLKEQEEKSQLIEAMKRQANEQCDKLRCDLQDKESGVNNLKDKIQALNVRCLELENESKEKDSCFYSETSRLEKELELLQTRLSNSNALAVASDPQSPARLSKLQQELDSSKKKEQELTEQISKLKSRVEDMSNRMEECQEPEAIGEIKMKYQSIIVDLEREKDDIETSLHVVKSENNKLKMRIKEEAYGVGAEMVKLLMHDDIDGASIEELEEEFRETFDEPDNTMIEKISASVKARSPINITADGKVTVDAQKLGLMKQTLIQLKVANGRTEKQIGFVKGICDQIVESLRQELKDLELEKAEVEKDLLNQISSINNAKAEMEDDLKAKLQIKEAALESAERDGGAKGDHTTTTISSSSERQLSESLYELEEQKRSIEKEMYESIQQRDDEIQHLQDKIRKMEEENERIGSHHRSGTSQATAQNSAEIQSEIRDLRYKLDESQEKVTDLRRTASEQKQIITALSADLKMANERIEQDKKIRLEKAMEGVEEKMEQIHAIHNEATTSMETLETMMKQLKARQEMEDKEGGFAASSLHTRTREDRKTAISLFDKGIEVREELRTSLQLIELKLMNRLQSLEDDSSRPRATTSNGTSKDNEQLLLDARDVAATLDEKALQIREECKNSLRKVERDITKRLALIEDDADVNEKTIQELKIKYDQQTLELEEIKSRNKLISTTASRQLMKQLDHEIHDVVNNIRSKDQMIKSLKVEVIDLQEEIDEILTEKGTKIKKLQEETLHLRKKMKTLEYNYSFSDDDDTHEEKEVATTEEEETSSPNRKDKGSTTKNKPSPFYKKVADKYKETTKTSAGVGGNGTPSLGYC